MRKKEFLESLERGLKGLPKSDIEEHVNFYSEMIDDRIEEGLNEEEAVNQIGTVNEVISQILAETPITKLVKERVKPKRALKAWEIVLLVLGSPLWFALIVVMLSLVFSAYVTVWALMVSFFAIELALGACSICGVVGLFVSGITGNWSIGVALSGFGIMCAGITILLALISKKIIQAILIITKKMTLGIKSLFIGGSK